MKNILVDFLNEVIVYVIHLWI